MNVEIRTEAEQFPEKENIKFSLQCGRRRGKDERKQNTLAPYMNRFKYYIYAKNSVIHTTER